MTLEVVCADLFDVLSGLEPESVSAIVCDPPYGLEFMGKAWDTSGGRLLDGETHHWTPPRAVDTLA